MDEDDKPPSLTVASSRSQVEIDREWRLREVRYATAEFAANLLRVMRGAGKDYLLLSELYTLANAVKECVDVGEHYEASQTIAETLHDALLDDWFGTERMEPYQTIVRGSLQLLASKMLGQATQQRRGESEIDDGIREMEAYWEKQRARWRPGPAPPAPRKRRSKPNSLDRLHTKPKPQESPAPVTPEPEPKTTADFMRRAKKKSNPEIE